MDTIIVLFLLFLPLTLGATECKNPKSHIRNIESTFVRKTSSDPTPEIDWRYEKVYLTPYQIIIASDGIWINNSGRTVRVRAIHYDGRGLFIYQHEIVLENDDESPLPFPFNTDFEQLR
jgi:hypothetical protein